MSFLAMALLIPRAVWPTTCFCPVDTPGNALEALEKAEHVVVAKVAAVKKIDLDELDADSLKMMFDGVGSTNSMDMASFRSNALTTVMSVEKMYKGSLKADDNLELLPGLCKRSFSEGSAALLYLDKPQGNPPRYVVSGCGRSGTVESAAEDIIYLDNISKVKGKTRISGHFSIWSDNPAPDFSGNKIIIRRDGKVWETATDKNGVFEVYDLPEGQYEIEPEPPAKWRIERISSASLVHGASDPDPELARALLGGPSTKNKTANVMLSDGKPASLEIRLAPENAIRGRLLSPTTGQPIVNGYARMEYITGGTMDFNPVDSNGRFEVRAARDGKFILSAQWPVDDSDRPGYSYYPGGINKDKAEVFTITPGAFFDIEFRVTEVEMIFFHVTALYPDGKTAMQANLTFTPEETGIAPRQFYFSSSFENGKYSIDLPKGVAGKLTGEIRVTNTALRGCPEKIDDTLPGLTMFRSGETLITGKEDGSEDIRLHFPVTPYCE